MSCDHIAELTDQQITNYGGSDLFSALGIDLVLIRNQANTDKIRNMSDDETEQLTPDQIEALGGVDLFHRLGKTIRFKLFRDLCREYLDQWQGKDWSGQMARVAYWYKMYGCRIGAGKRPLRLSGIRHKQVVQLKVRGVNLNWRFPAKSSYSVVNIQTPNHKVDK